MIETRASCTAAACAGRQIVVAQDTTEIAGREERRRGLGPAGDCISADCSISCRSERTVNSACSSSARSSWLGRRDRRPPDRRVYLVGLRRQTIEGRVHQRAESRTRTQRICAGRAGSAAVIR
jgi:hypothetical protein